MSLAGVAKETLEILERGEYRAPSGKTVSIREDLERAVRGTLLFRPGDLDGAPATATRESKPRVEVTSEKTATAARRLIEVERAGPVTALNFASARNPGGGFIGGAKAQEEDLARCSGLYACLEPQRAYYEANRANASLLYTDHVIASPSVPFFRDDELELLETPFLLSVITAPAPNAGEELRRRPDARAEIKETLERRARLVLRAAEKLGPRTIVLGAWGCGVFRNDPDDVAAAFEGALTEHARALDRVVFAVWERGGDGPNLRAFRRLFSQ